MSTNPEVFIVESLDFEDEAKGRHEGEILARMLKLMGKTQTTYFYIRTRAELEEIIDKFDESGARYLHLSCHANKTSMATTLDSVPFEQLGEMLGPCLNGRRIFLSACEMANARLAKALFPGTGLHSIVGPARKIYFDDSAAFWVAFYHLMFKADDARMQHSQLERLVGDLERLFGERFNYYRKTDNARGYRLIDTRGGA
ncbi:hypothetical protein [Phenylobacterium sp.]|uniref:hypothetical protein n=1 Tax=Phenylobacterium sp. TaxID=1871053 RepID=UPI0035B28784